MNRSFFNACTFHIEAAIVEYVRNNQGNNEIPSCVTTGPESVTKYCLIE